MAVLSSAFSSKAFVVVLAVLAGCVSLTLQQGSSCPPSCSLEIVSVPPSTAIDCNEPIPNTYPNATSCTPVTITESQYTSGTVCNVNLCRRESSTQRIFTISDQCGHTITRSSTVWRTNCTIKCPPCPRCPTATNGASVVDDATAARFVTDAKQIAHATVHSAVSRPVAQRALALLAHALPLSPERKQELADARTMLDVKRVGSSTLSGCSPDCELQVLHYPEPQWLVLPCNTSTPTDLPVAVSCTPVNVTEKIYQLAPTCDPAACTLISDVERSMMVYDQCGNSVVYTQTITKRPCAITCSSCPTCIRAVGNDLADQAQQLTKLALVAADPTSTWVVQSALETLLSLSLTEYDRHEIAYARSKLN